MNMVNKKRLNKMSWDLFGTDYYLVVAGTKEKPSWELYLTNKDIEIEDKLLLTSEKNTFKELKQFIKTRKKIRVISNFMIWQIIVSVIILFILIINGFANWSSNIKNIVRAVCLSLNAYIMISNIVLSKLSDKDFSNEFSRNKDKINIISKELDKKIEEALEELDKAIEKTNKIKKQK